MPIDFDNQWTSNVALILGYVNARNREGQVYPIWATCLGFETLMYITSGFADNVSVFTEVFGQDGKTCPMIVQSEESELLQPGSNCPVRYGLPVNQNRAGKPIRILATHSF